jgi:hypothetical protein
VTDKLGFDPEELASAMREAYGKLIDFVNTPAFLEAYRELMDTPVRERPKFVANVFFQPSELDKRGIEVPEGILIQTSAFGDRRPTLFVIKKLLPPKFNLAWGNVNLTISNEYAGASIPRDPSKAWRTPLPVQIQNALLRSGVDLEALPDSFGSLFEENRA